MKIDEKKKYWNKREEREWQESDELRKRLKEKERRVKRWIEKREKEIERSMWNKTWGGIKEERERKI